AIRSTKHGWSRNARRARARRAAARSRRAEDAAQTAANSRSGSQDDLAAVFFLVIEDLVSTNASASFILCEVKAGIGDRFHAHVLRSVVNEGFHGNSCL